MLSNDIRAPELTIIVSERCCAQHTGMHRVVVEALLVAIYLTEMKDVYIPIRSTSLPEATIVQLPLSS